MEAPFSKYMLLPYETLVGLTLVKCWDRWRVFPGGGGGERSRFVCNCVMFKHCQRQYSPGNIFVYIDFWKPQLYLSECYCSLCENIIDVSLNKPYKLYTWKKTTIGPNISLNSINLDELSTMLIVVLYNVSELNLTPPLLLYHIKYLPDHAIEVGLPCFGFWFSTYKIRKPLGVFPKVDVRHRVITLCFRLT